MSRNRSDNVSYLRLPLLTVFSDDPPDEPVSKAIYSTQQCRPRRDPLQITFSHHHDRLRTAATGVDAAGTDDRIRKIITQKISESGIEANAPAGAAAGVGVRAKRHRDQWGIGTTRIATAIATLTCVQCSKANNPGCDQLRMAITDRSAINERSLMDSEHPRNTHHARAKANAPSRHTNAQFHAQ